MSSSICALHGNLGSFRDWDFLRLPEVDAVDLWAHSQLPFLEFATMLRDKTEPNSLLVGYSLGGRLALHAMAMYPGHWAGVVIISAHPGLCCVEDCVARRVSDEIWAKHAREMDWPQFVRKWNQQSVLGDAPDIETQLSLEIHREGIARAFENWSLGKQDDLKSSLRKFKNPVRWITGESDKKFTQIAEEMTDVFPEFQQVVFQDCGHRVLLDAPEELAEEVNRFYERICV